MPIDVLPKLLAVRHGKNRKLLKLRLATELCSDSPAPDENYWSRPRFFDAPKTATSFSIQGLWKRLEPH
jgi:hypothetical protein